MWSLAPGARLKISTPGNHFELGRGRPQYLLLAGGIGITPIYTMALALANSGRGFPGALCLPQPRRTSRLPTSCAPPSATGLNVFVDDEGARIDLAAEIAAPGPRRRSLCLRPDRHAGGCQARVAGERDARWTGCASKLSATAAASRPQAFEVRIPRLGQGDRRSAQPDDARSPGGGGRRHDLRLPERRVRPVRASHPRDGGIVDHRDVFFSDEEKAANAKLCTCVSRVAAARSRSTRRIEAPESAAAGRLPVIVRRADQTGEGGPFAGAVRGPAIALTSTPVRIRKPPASV